MGVCGGRLRSNHQLCRLGSLFHITETLPARLWTWVALLLELLISASLILGIGTRYDAILVLAFVVVATVIAHRYWEFSAGP